MTLSSGTYRFCKGNFDIKIVVTTKDYINKDSIPVTNTFTKLIFNKGDEKELMTEIVNQESTQNFRHIFYVTHTNSKHIATIAHKKDDMSAFDYYYTPNLKFIVNWIDNMKETGKVVSSKQFSIFCHGKPRTGKTMLVKRIAEYTNRDVLCVDLMSFKKKSDLIDLFYRNMNDKADYGRRIIFFIDEFDKVVKKMGLIKRHRIQKDLFRSVAFERLYQKEKQIDTQLTDFTAERWRWFYLCKFK